MGLVTLVAAIAGQVLTAAFYNNNLNAIVNQINGSIDGTNIADLSITAAKLATSAVDLAGTKITGNLGVAHLNNGTNASSGTFWRGDGTWAALSATLPKGYVYGGVLSNDSTTKLDNTALSARSDDDAYTITVAALHKDANVAFSEGDNGGAWDTGTVGGAKIVYVYAIGDSTGVKSGDILMSASGTSPTMPSGFNKKRLIGGRRWGGSSFDTFYSDGVGSIRTTHYDAPAVVLNGGAAGSFTDVDCSAYIPPKANTQLIGGAGVYVHGENAQGIMYARVNGSSSTNGTQVCWTATSIGSSGSNDYDFNEFVMHAPDGIVEYKMTGSNAYLWVHGFIESL